MWRTLTCSCFLLTTAVIPVFSQEQKYSEGMKVLPEAEMKKLVGDWQCVLGDGQGGKLKLLIKLRLGPGKGEPKGNWAVRGFPKYISIRGYWFAESKHLKGYGPTFTGSPALLLDDKKNRFLVELPLGGFYRVWRKNREKSIDELVRMKELQQTIATLRIPIKLKGNVLKIQAIELKQKAMPGVLHRFWKWEGELAFSNVKK